MTHIQQWAVANGQATVLLELGKLSLKEPVEDPIAGIPLVNPVKKQNIQVPVRIPVPIYVVGYASNLIDSVAKSESGF